MIKYKLLYELCVDAWKQDLECSKNLTDKARTYVVVIGFVFSYSLFNLNIFYSTIEATLKEETWTISSSLLDIVSVLFILYFFCLSISLICTLFSLKIRAYYSLPTITEIAEFKEAGPSDAGLEQQYYQLSKMVQKATNNNAAKTVRQGLYLTIAIWCLTIGMISIILIGSLFIFCKVF